LRYFHALVDENKVEVGYAEDYNFGRLALGGALRFRR
jgi:hypothetical protein